MEKTEKEYKNDLERYQVIVNYFEENQNRIKDNLDYLGNMQKTLIDIEKDSISNELYDSVAKLTTKIFYLGAKCW